MAVIMTTSLRKISALIAILICPELANHLTIWRGDYYGDCLNRGIHKGPNEHKYNLKESQGIENSLPWQKGQTITVDWRTFAAIVSQESTRGEINHPKWMGKLNVHTRQQSTLVLVLKLHVPIPSHWWRNMQLRHMKRRGSLKFSITLQKNVCRKVSHWS